MNFTPTLANIMDSNVPHEVWSIAMAFSRIYFNGYGSNRFFKIINFMANAILGKPLCCIYANEFIPNK